jgi:hypothetical protein
MRGARLTGIVLAAGLVASAGCRRSADAATPEPAEDWCAVIESATAEVADGVTGPLHALNGEFLAAHARARAEACTRLVNEGLVLRYTFGALEGRWKGRPIGPVQVLPPEFHPIKDVSHAVFLAALLVREPWSSATRGRVDSAIAAITAAERELAAESTARTRIPATLLPAQLRLLARTREALTQHREQRLDAAAQARFFAAVREDVTGNLRAVAGAVVRGLYAEVTRIRAEVTREDPDAWAGLVVVVAVSHQSRAREISVQFFERLLAEPVGEGARGERRLIVAEGRTLARDQMGLVATHVVDRVGAAAIFADPERLQRDAMAEDDGALDELLPRR